MLHVTICAIFCLLSLASAGLVTTHHVFHEPAFTKVGHVVNTGPSAVSHQSITQVHGKTHLVEPIVAPEVKSTIHNTGALVVEPVIPVVHTYKRVPVVHSVPLVHTAPIVSVH